MGQKQKALPTRLIHLDTPIDIIQPKQTMRRATNPLITQLLYVAAGDKRRRQNRLLV